MEMMFCNALEQGALFSQERCCVTLTNLRQGGFTIKQRGRTNRLPGKSGTTALLNRAPDLSLYTYIALLRLRGASHTRAPQFLREQFTLEGRGEGPGLTRPLRQQSYAQLPGSKFH